MKSFDYEESLVESWLINESAAAASAAAAFTQLEQSHEMATSLADQSRSCRGGKHGEY